ncbi:MAG: DUF2007 domain-containing protein [Paracoccus sp. (in: a-proteobacteria)]|nr:DUF2007 domain-containing protein [Paracoccus sp. (in: a-proteobacteria)]
MKELFRTTNTLRLIRAQDLLRSEGIETYALDQHMSVLAGSTLAIPQRLMIADRDEFMARAILRDNDLDHD